MYLEKLEIQGFKSFAKRNVLKFPAFAKASAGKNKEKKTTGLTAIVGPNGVGKSNIADAVRWVLGEQSYKLLRGKRSEDVIFSGSSKKASLSFSEVSLHLNNEDRSAPIDYRELVLTRRLYRDGESEYLLNGSKVRLLDITMLLAKCKFGQRAYSVIGQGMVENFLNTSMAERKEFFDEATGVKMYQIKRDESLNKLKNTQNNLSQAESLLVEIEPRLRSLTRQIKKLEKRAEFAEELKEKQKQYYSSAWHRLSKELKQINKKLIKYEDAKREQNRKLAEINKELLQCELSQFQDDNFSKLQNKQKKLQEERNELGQKLAEVKAKISISYEAKGKFDTAWLIKQEECLQGEVDGLKQKVKKAESKKDEAQKKLQVLKDEQERLDKKIADLKKKIFNMQKSGSNREINEKLEKLKEINEIILKCAETGKIGRIKELANTLKNKLQELKKYFSENKEDGSSSVMQKQITELEGERLKLTDDYIVQQTKIKSAEEQMSYYESQIRNRQKEIKEINDKVAGQKDKVEGKTDELSVKEKEIKKKLEEINQDLQKTEDKINKINKEEAGKREKVIELQKQSQGLQSEYNQNSNALNEIKIDKARVETKLEDLENEIRNETRNLRMIMDTPDEHQNVNRESLKEDIEKLKRQLELIGGIDPETEKEYKETKERFEFLSTQATDLRSATRSLEKIVAELDKTIEEQFDKNFKEIARTFEKYFKILFNGGSAKLIKVMEDVKSQKDEDEMQIMDGEEVIEAEQVKKKESIFRKTKQVLAGIEIQASPPDKKIKSISMLSGGERALTAIALISAIIAVNPSPFVVLDEVDAALDEANSELLGKVLDDLSNKTQFIVITHNRVIMYKADIIYGVTMGDDGISKLLSLKVEDAVTAAQ